MPELLLNVQDLKKHYRILKGLFSRIPVRVKAVDGVSLRIQKGETVGLVGESGCGKSTLGRLILRLEEPDAGTIRFAEQDILALDTDRLQVLRRQMQIIYQDPYSSLNPRQRVDSIIAEPLDIHGLAKGRERAEQIVHLLEIVGLRAEQRLLYPHQFSGGQRQRIAIARALASQPRFIIADEPVSALDVSIQAQIVNLLIDLQTQFDLTYLFISHDLNLIEYIADWLAVMYLGKIVEWARQDVIFSNPVHPYSEALFSATPTLDPLNKSRRILLQGDVPSPVNPPPGCRFHTRCPLQIDICRQAEPILSMRPNGSLVACHVR
jgi:oligopeptide/dipeptide ABC transporter ATP-binding protein